MLQSYFKKDTFFACSTFHLTNRLGLVCVWQAFLSVCLLVCPCTECGQNFSKIKNPLSQRQFFKIQFLIRNSELYLHFSLYLFFLALFFPSFIFSLFLCLSFLLSLFLCFCVFLSFIYLSFILSFFLSVSFFLSFFNLSFFLSFYSLFLF